VCAVFAMYHKTRRKAEKNSDPACFCIDGIVAVILLELSQLIWHISIAAADFAVFKPQQVERYTAFLEFLVDIFIVRHLVFRFAFCSDIQQITKLLILHFIGKRIGEIVCFGKPQYLDHGST